MVQSSYSFVFSILLWEFFFLVDCFLLKFLCQQISWTLLRIQPDLNDIIVWMVSTRPLIFKSSGPFTKPFGINPSAPTTIGISITFMLHRLFFSSLGISWYLFLLFPSFYFYLVVRRDGQVHNLACSLFLLLLTITRTGRMAEIRWSVCISKSQRIFCISLSRTDLGLCIYHYCVWSNLIFLHNSQWITFSTQSNLSSLILFLW